MKKRWISMMLVLCMAATLLAGCGKEGDKKANNGERVTLTVGLPQNGVTTDFEDNAFTKYIEENLNVDIEVVLFATATEDFEKQLTLMSVSNEELPDVILGYIGMAKGTVYNFGRNGVLMDLTDLLEEYGTNFNAQRSALSKDLQRDLDLKMKDPENGKIYGMPWYTEFITVDNMQPCTININKDWLNAVGMSAPTNIDELYNVLKAFKEKDPNGNGKADEIPMLGQGIISYIINAFTYYEQGTPYAVTDGKVYNPSITDEYREAMKFINKLVQEDLLSDLNFTMTSGSEFINMISPSDNVAKVGIWCGHPELTTTTNNSILNQYTALGELGDATGKGGYMVVTDNQFYFTGLVTKDCDEPEMAMQFLDFLYKDESVTRARWGEKEVDWTESEGTNMNGTKSVIKRTSSQLEANQTWTTTLCGINTEENYLSIVDLTDDIFGQRNRLSTENAKMIQNARIKEETLFDVVFNEAERESMASVSNDVVSYMLEMQSKFAIGDQNINDDNVWNSYKAEIERLGSSELIKVVQKAYDNLDK